MRQLARVTEELQAHQIEKAAADAQSESMVQLVVVAPSVHVSLGDDMTVHTHDLDAVLGSVAHTINNDVLPPFLRVFAGKLPSGLNTSNLPPGYVEQLIQDMQTTIAGHLKPVLTQAWGSGA
jgi:hypothetical protein